jgi:penicillin-binding protein 1A
MVNSRNLVSIRLLRGIGIEYAREYIERFGFEREEMPANLSMALGSASLTPLSMARGYAVFANGGFLVTPQFIRRISTSDGSTVYETLPSLICQDCLAEASEPEQTEAPIEINAPELRPLDITSGEEKTGRIENFPVRSLGTEGTLALEAITPQNAYLVRSMMMDVVRRGTGVRAMQLGRSDLAGKTGTTNEQRDAWFSGRRELGGRAALPVWIEFMAVALEGLEDRPPVMPEGLAQARIDPETGLLARLENQDAIMEIFQAGNLPSMQEEEQGVNPDVPLEEDPYEIY